MTAITKDGQLSYVTSVHPRWTMFKSPDAMRTLTPVCLICRAFKQLAPLVTMCMKLLMPPPSYHWQPMLMLHSLKVQCRLQRKKYFGPISTLCHGCGLEEESEWQALSLYAHSLLPSKLGPLALLRMNSFLERILIIIKIDPL